MVKTINAAIIGCNMSEDFFTTSATNSIERFSWKKIFLSGKSASTKSHSQAELVEKAEAIINDADIDLVFVSENHLQYVKPIIAAGKSVRVV
jgi:predicted dehydrogenase